VIYGVAGSLSCGRRRRGDRVTTESAGGGAKKRVKQAQASGKIDNQLSRDERGCAKLVWGRVLFQMTT